MGTAPAIVPRMALSKPRTLGCSLHSPAASFSPLFSRRAPSHSSALYAAKRNRNLLVGYTSLASSNSCLFQHVAMVSLLGRMPVWSQQGGSERMITMASFAADQETVVKPESEAESEVKEEKNLSKTRQTNEQGSYATEKTTNEEEPLLVRAAKREKVERAPAWMMRQAGRYMADYRKLAVKHPSFRERSENVDLIVEISLQPWKAFRPDGVIIFSDILTPLPAIGIPFEIDETKGPVLESPIESETGLQALHSIDLKQVKFVGDSLSILRNEVGNGAAVIGFVGAPWTLATYIVEGKTTRTYTKIKSMTHQQPELLHSILSHLANEIAEYVIFQVNAGAQCVQIFDSWGGQLPPHQWDRWSKPYIQQLVAKVRQSCPGVPLVMYINGNGGLLERMATVDVDVIGLDWTIDMEDGRRRLGDSIAVQGNVDPAVLFAPLPAITEAVESVVRKAGNNGHILNLGHGVLVGTPEEGVAHFFDTARSLTYKSAELAA